MRCISLQDQTHYGALAETEQILRGGGVVAVPTDTVYGLIGDATNAEAIEKIFAIKNRPDEKALPVFVKDIPTARRYAYISDPKARFLEKVWPGPVTLVFHHKEKLPDRLVGGKSTLGLRIPDHRFLLELLGRLDFPIAQTSANVSGGPPARSRAEIEAYFSEALVQPDLVLDGGELSARPSTVLDFTGPRPVVLRMGMRTKEELDQFFHSWVG